MLPSDTPEVELIPWYFGRRHRSGLIGPRIAAPAREAPGATLQAAAHGANTSGPADRCALELRGRLGRLRGPRHRCVPTR